MNIFLPTSLEKSVAEFGDEGARWLAGLPERIEELEREAPEGGSDFPEGSPQASR